MPHLPSEVERASSDRGSRSPSRRIAPGGSAVVGHHRLREFLVEHSVVHASACERVDLRDGFAAQLGGVSSNANLTGPLGVRDATIERADEFAEDRHDATRGGFVTDCALGHWATRCGLANAPVGDESNERRPTRDTCRTPLPWNTIALPLAVSTDRGVHRDIHHRLDHARCHGTLRERTRLRFARDHQQQRFRGRCGGQSNVRSCRRVGDAYLRDFRSNQSTELPPAPAAHTFRAVDEPIPAARELPRATALRAPVIADHGGEKRLRAAPLLALRTPIDRTQ